MNKELKTKYIEMFKQSKSDFDPAKGYFESTDKTTVEKSDFFRGQFSLQQDWIDKTTDKIFKPSFNEAIALGFFIGAARIEWLRPDLKESLDEVIEKIASETKVFKLACNDYFAADEKGRGDIGEVIESLSGFKRSDNEIFGVFMKSNRRDFNK